MREIFIWILGFIIFAGLVIGLSYAFGWINIHQIKTIGKERQNVEREVFENTNSFTKAKRQEAIKYYAEYQSLKTDKEKNGLKSIVALSLADFDEDKYIKDEKLLKWIKEMKY